MSLLLSDQSSADFKLLPNESEHMQGSALALGLFRLLVDRYDIKAVADLHESIAGEGGDDKQLPRRADRSGIEASSTLGSSRPAGGSEMTTASQKDVHELSRIL